MDMVILVSNRAALPVRYTHRTCSSDLTVYQGRSIVLLPRQ